MSRMSDLDIEISEIGELIDQLSERVDALPMKSTTREAVIEMLYRALETLEDEFALKSSEW